VLTLRRDRKAGAQRFREEETHIPPPGKTRLCLTGKYVKGSPVEDKTERPEDPAPARSRSNHIVARVRRVLARPAPAQADRARD